MKIRLNLATAPTETQRRFVLGTGLLGTLALGALIWLSWNTYSAWHRERDHRARMAQLSQQIDDLRRQRRQLEDFFGLPNTLQVRERAAFLNGLIEQRSFPWTKIFMDLEHILPEGVHVISISPRMISGRVEVKIVVGAATDETKLKFLRSLEDSKEFSRIQLLSEVHPAAGPGDTDRVRLELVAWYVTV
jgi:Tfp pilus assembly protein PilN